MDVTPDALVSEVFVEVLPKILKTKTADMARKLETPEKNSSPSNLTFSDTKSKKGG